MTYGRLITIALLLTIQAGCRTASSRAPTTVSQAPSPTAGELASQMAKPRVAERVPPTVQPAASATPGQPNVAARPVAYQQPGSSSEGLPANPPTPEAVTAPVAPLDLPAVIEMSLERNPDLIALRRNEGVAEGVMGVAQTYPFNPWVQVQATPIQQNRQGGSGATYHYVLLMQNLQLAHQQRYRDQIGSTALNTVRWNIHQAELLNLAQTERFYFTALYLRGVRDLLRANAQLNSQLLTVLQRQLEAGAVAGADVAIVRLDNQSTQHQARLAEQNYQTALLDLRRQLNLSTDVPLELYGDLTWYSWRSADVDRLAEALGACGPAQGAARVPLEQIVLGRPDVLAAQSDVDTARANERLANASRTPDLLIGPYYQRTDSGTDFYGFRAQTDIMVVNTGMPLLRQRQAELRQRYAVWQQLQARATIEAQAAIERYERARRLLAELGNVTDQAVPVELERLEQQFRAGEVDILRLFTARTSLIQNRRAQLDTLNEVAQAAAQVTVATAVPPHALITASRPQP